MMALAIFRWYRIDRYDSTTHIQLFPLIELLDGVIGEAHEEVGVVC